MTNQVENLAYAIRVLNNGIAATATPPDGYVVGEGPVSVERLSLGRVQLDFEHALSLEEVNIDTQSNGVVMLEFYLDGVLSSSTFDSIVVSTYQ